MSFVRLSACAALGLALAAMTAVAPARALAHQAASVGDAVLADRFLDAGNGWRTYINGRYGMRLSYPADLLTPLDAPPDGDGRRFAGDDLQMEVFAWPAEAGETARSLSASLVGTEGYQEIAQEVISEDRLVLSGLRGDRVFYEVYVFGGQTLQAFGMEFPAAMRARYEPLAFAIAATFVSADEEGMTVADAAQACAPYRSCSAIAAAPLAFPEPAPLLAWTPSLAPMGLLPLDLASYAGPGHFPVFDPTGSTTRPVILASADAPRIGSRGGKPGKAVARAGKRDRSKGDKIAVAQRKNKGKGARDGGKRRDAKADGGRNKDGRNAGRSGRGKGDGGGRGGKGGNGKGGGGKGGGGKGGR